MTAERNKTVYQRHSASVMLQATRLRYDAMTAHECTIVGKTKLPLKTYTSPWPGISNLKSTQLRKGRTNFSDTIDGKSAATRGDGTDKTQTHMQTEPPHPPHHARVVIMLSASARFTPCETPVTTFPTFAHATLSPPVFQTARDCQAGHSFAPSRSLHIETFA